MIYKLLHKTTNGVQILARIDDDNVCRVTCTENDQAYLRWLEAGNTPTPAEENQ
jgi:phosphosulfolactate phosphohydrolase-like enzyme